MTSTYYHSQEYIQIQELVKRDRRSFVLVYFGWPKILLPPRAFSAFSYLVPKVSTAGHSSGRFLGIKNFKNPRSDLGPSGRNSSQVAEPSKCGLYLDPVIGTAAN